DWRFQDSPPRSSRHRKGLLQLQRRQQSLPVLVRQRRALHKNGSREPQALEEPRRRVRTKTSASNRSSHASRRGPGRERLQRSQLQNAIAFAAWGRRTWGRGTREAVPAVHSREGILRPARRGPSRFQGSLRSELLDTKTWS